MRLLRALARVLPSETSEGERNGPRELLAQVRSRNRRHHREEFAFLALIIGVDGRAWLEAGVLLAHPRKSCVLSAPASRQAEEAITRQIHAEAVAQQEWQAAEGGECRLDRRGDQSIPGAGISARCRVAHSLKAGKFQP